MLQQLRMLRSSDADLREQTSLNDNITAYKRQLVARAYAGASKVGSDSIQALDVRILAVSRTLQENQGEQGNSLFACPVTSPTAQLRCRAAIYQRQVKVEIARQELGYLQRLRAYLIAASGQAAAYREFTKSAIIFNAARARLLQLQDERAKLTPVDALRITLPVIMGKKLGALSTQIAQAEQAYKLAQDDYQKQVKNVAHISALAQRPVFSLDIAAIEAVTRDLAERVAQSRAAVSGNWLSRLGGPVLAVLPVALLVLLSSFLGHFLVKALFYYVLAPLAARRAPIRLEAPPQPHCASTTPATAQPRQTGVSAVSQDIWLEADEELLILPEFLQSSSTGALKDTKFLLDCSSIWTSLVSGMYLLTRIRTSSRDDRIVISSDADPMSEIALVTIAAGSAMVFQPRGMVGVIYHASTPLKISRRWRIFSAHAWLTLQLRYLIFRGPVTLIVRGSRGVRVEAAGTARTISQYATLGFSSHLHYATVRSETFWPYYQNRTALLLDHFEGEHGYYVYDETPRFGKNSGFFARGLEGLTDAVMKVFGI